MNPVTDSTVGCGSGGNNNNNNYDNVFHLKSPFKPLKDTLQGTHKTTTTVHQTI